MISDCVFRAEESRGTAAHSSLLAVQRKSRYEGERRLTALSAAAAEGLSLNKHRGSHKDSYLSLHTDKDSVDDAWKGAEVRITF